MAVIRKNEIELNSIKYPITDKVRPILSAKFAEKMVVGEYTKDSNPEVDSWVLADNRGGILAEEMDETRQANRAWWSTCNLGFKGHILLPRKATAIAIPTTHPEPTYTPLNPSFEDWSGGDPENWTPSSSARVIEETVIIRNGSSSCEIFTEASTEENYIEQLFSNPTEWIGYDITVTVYSRMDGDAAAGLAWLRLYRNGVQIDTDSTRQEGSWDLLTTTYTVPSGTTSLTIRLAGESTSNTSHKGYYFEDVAVSYTAPVAKTRPTAWANFNGELYAAFGNFLYKLNDTGDGWTVVPLIDIVYGFDYAITKLISSVANKLYIYFGDTGNYKYMDTDETIHDTDVADATFGIGWDSKLFKMTSAGSLAYDTVPNEANPSWTDDGDLADEGLADNDVQELFIYRDASGNPIIYAGTKLGLYAHSFGNDKWTQTELAMPYHDTAGKGVVHWRDKAYISAGLDVLAYQTGQAGTSIVSVGLDRDDGLPRLRGGEIVKFIKGYNEFFALVDSTYEGVTSRSTVMAYDKNGWQCWWEAGSDNLAMSTGIISTKVAHRLWYGAGTNVYWIPLQKNLRNPKKVSTFPYDTTGIHITPWFDANWVGQKLALQYKVFCKDVTADETVLVEYRIDHIEVDLTTGWTTLGTIAASGNEVETVYTFGSSLGTNFKAIQFRFTLSRRTSTEIGTETLRPIAAGDETDFDYSSGYDKVDEVIADGVTTIIEHQGLTYARELYNLPPHLGMGIISKVTLHFRVRGSGNYNCIKGAIKSNSTVTETAEKNPYDDFGSFVWGDYTQEWAVNPADAEAWEWSDIDSLQIGLAMKREPVTRAQCTQLYIVVEYDASAEYSPDVQYAVLEYQKIIKPTWGWAFTIDCTQAYNGKTADQMLSAVVTAAELETLTPFVYKDTTYYVRVKSVEGERLTGDGQKGTYNVTVLKPI